MPLQLLPGPVFRLSYALMVVAGVKENPRISSRKFRCVIDIIGNPCTDNALRKVIGKIFFGAQVEIGPYAPFIA